MYFLISLLYLREDSSSFFFYFFIQNLIHFFWESCVFICLFENVMVFKRQDYEISYLTLNVENILILVHFVLSPFSLPRVPFYSIHVSYI